MKVCDGCTCLTRYRQVTKDILALERAYQSGEISRRAAVIGVRDLRAELHAVLSCSAEHPDPEIRKEAKAQLRSTLFMGVMDLPPEPRRDYPPQPSLIEELRSMGVIR